MSPHRAPPEATAQPSESSLLALIERLRDPRCYAHSVERVTVIETHISYLLLTGTVAYKIKKPLLLPFLDYSTLERRRLACEEELVLNRRTAPALYLAVVPICGSARAPAVASRGPVLEYAVQMRQFAADALFIDLLRRDALLPAHIDALAGTVAAFHSSLPPANAASRYGDPASIHAWATENFTMLARMDLDARLHARLDALQAWSDATFRALEPLMIERKRAGCIRECHGDLHLANVTLIDGAPVPFDCIEFNPALRWIDTISEIAFLYMDLLHSGRRDYAYRLLNAYLEASGDYSGLTVLRYYAVYRALVRAKVAGIRAGQGTDSAAADRARNELAAYVALAERLIAIPDRCVIITHGLSGSGKSTVAQRIAQTWPAIRIRSDVERKRLHAVPTLASSQSALGGGIYTADANQRTYARLAELARSVLQSGESVIVDATFLRRAERAPFRVLADEQGARFAIVTCTAAYTALEQRITVRGPSGRDASEADLAVLARQTSLVEAVDTTEADHVINVQTDMPIASLQQEIDRDVVLLRERRHQQSN